MLLYGISDMFRLLYSIKVTQNTACACLYYNFSFHCSSFFLISLNTLPVSCPAGTENNGMSNACDPCMIGYYKDVEAAARCRPCGNFSENDIRITNTNGSTSITNCTKCKSFQYIMVELLLVFFKFMFTV